MPVRRLALAAPAAALALALTGCGGDGNEDLNPNGLPEDRTVAEPTIIRTPVKVEGTPPLVVPQPGPTGVETPGEDPPQSPTFSPGPDGETGETSERGPDGS